MDHEDPINHVVNFYQIVESPRTSDNKEEELYLRLSPHCLIGRAKYWYLNQPTTTITNWNILKDKFIKRVLPT